MSSLCWPIILMRSTDNLVFTLCLLRISLFSLWRQGTPCPRSRLQRWSKPGQNAWREWLGDLIFGHPGVVSQLDKGFGTQMASDRSGGRNHDKVLILWRDVRQLHHKLPFLRLPGNPFRNELRHEHHRPRFFPQPLFHRLQNLLTLICFSCIPFLSSLFVISER